jgi:predicted ATPase/class 3 adenylate cyclase
MSREPRTAGDVTDSEPQHRGRLPTGDVAFLVADIEDSTRHLLELGAGYSAAQESVFRVLRSSVADFAGVAVKSTGDGLIAAFADPQAATNAAVAAQRQLRRQPGPDVLIVRIGVHVGPATTTRDATDYVSLALNQATRVCDAGHGGQILISDVAAHTASGGLPEGTHLRDRGPHLLKGLPDPVVLYELVDIARGADERPLRAARVGRTPPRERSRFVGRDAELASLVELTREFPLVTLVGPGGVGKTRLLLEALGTIQHAFPEGAWFVPLSDIADPTLVPNAVATALGIGETVGADVVAGLLIRLRDAQLVLALDNCEQVVDATADLVATVLAECPGVQFVATSREPLNLSSEALLEVAPFQVPLDAAASEITSSSAVQLFDVRARQVDQHFAVTPDNAVHVARICQLADGLPLAIELLAPLVRRHSLPELVAEVESRAIVMQGRGRPQRHLSLRSSIDWGYRLLTDFEQQVFRRTSVFAGGFSLAAATSVIASDAASADAVASTLSRLLDKSLLSRAVEDRSRYRLLETIRIFAAEELTASGEAVEVGRAHAQWYLELAESTEAETRHRALAAERDNLRAALAWSADRDDAVLRRLVAALVPFWRMRGEFAEGRRWLATTRARAAGDQANQLALAEGTFAFQLGEYGAALELLNLAIAGFSAAGDEIGVARATDVLGRLAAYRGEGETARFLFERAVTQFRRAGDEASVASVLRALGRLARYRGHYDASAQYIEDALAASARAQSDHELAETLHDLGRLANRRAEYDKAAELLQRALTQYREIGDEQGAANALYGLARAFLGNGDVATGTNLLRSAVERFRALGDLHGGGWPLGALARALLDQDDVETAETLFDEAYRTGERLDSDPIRMMALVGLADVSARRRDSAAAHGYLARARQLATAIGYQSELAEIDARLADLGAISG